MSPGAAILDELVFMPAELARAQPLEPTPAVARNSYVIKGNRRIFHYSPFFVRDLKPSQFGTRWNFFCGLLRSYGIPIFSGTQELQAVPATALPARWSRRYINEPLDFLDLTTADAFELACYDRNYHHWGWSHEFPVSCTPTFLNAVRQAAGGDIPVGLGLPMSCHVKDQLVCLNAKVDFISLVARFAHLELIDLGCLANLRRESAKQHQPDVPIWVTAPITTATEAFKLLALGASAICVDPLLRPLLPKQLTTSSTNLGVGMLSSITSYSVSQESPLPDIQRALESLDAELRQLMQYVGATALSQVNATCLRCCSERSATLTGLAPL